MGWINKAKRADAQVNAWLEQFLTDGLCSHLTPIPSLSPIQDSSGSFIHPPSASERMSSVSEQTGWEEGPGKCSFFTKRWTPTGKESIAKLIFLHGFMEHISRYDHVFQRYAEAGIEVFAFDQRGFGQTAARTKTQGQTSWPAGLKDADFFIMKEASPECCNSRKVFLMGHSMGGGLAFAYTTRSPPREGLPLITGGLVLSSPLIEQTPGVAAAGALIRLGSFLGAVLPKLTLKVGVASKDISRDPVIQEQYVHDPLCAPVGTYKGVGDMLLGGQQLLSHDYKLYPSTLPLLAVHGTADNVTWHDATQQLVEKTNAADKTFKDFEGFYHEMHNEPGDDKFKEIDFIIQWILSHVSK
ncbi:hypothetical protein PCANC_14901 [Puccinia coronata f. sp. avenae]|uniref:Serine aminopeptidase S33 domain-containing protein n=1 Tax=Puccinia coronata f. sp. avenae TaxID=200324 RepID=A0A2N5V091_9BASI|nr:hypothetical protein PCANC_14901 [Puccinia coronata f. sp. avenae]PLW43415.1 hypothetical protein PCASD_07521 [Puccinia coronata f. sp. avenae]